MASYGGFFVGEEGFELSGRFAYGKDVARRSGVDHDSQEFTPRIMVISTM